VVPAPRHRYRSQDDPRAVAEGGFLTVPVSGTPPPHVVAAANTLRIDLVTVEVMGLLGAGGIASILLKGPTFARWLYDDPHDRPYTDTDLLISPDDLEKARGVLAGAGFAAPFSGAGHERIHHAEPWIRSEDAAEIDLHHRLPGIADSHLSWRVLSRRTEPARLRGHEVTMLDAPARAFHVALHAAQHGTGRTPAVRDVEHALERLTEETWREAAEIARATGAEAAFAAGLRLAEGGEAVLERLDLARPGDSSWELAQILRDEEPGEALVHGLVWFRNVRGIRAKVVLLVFKAFPPRAVLATWSPLARRGFWGLVVARVWRPIWLVAHAPAALVRLRRARALQRERSRGGSAG
jgi:hypothetical protein